MKEKSKFMKIDCLLTAKGNNTLKDKNILLLNDKPVLYYPAIAAKQVSLIDNFYVSSDCDKILTIANDLGYEKIKRPDELSQPNSQHVDVIKHYLNLPYISEDMPDILVVLLGNNITVKSTWIQDCINIMKNDMTISCVAPVYEDSDHNPYRCKKINNDGFLESFVDNSPVNLSTNRQDLPKSYFLSHNFWVINVKKFLNNELGDAPWSFMGKKVFPYKTEMSIDIHDYFDMGVARLWLDSQTL